MDVPKILTYGWYKTISPVFIKQLIFLQIFNK